MKKLLILLALLSLPVLVFAEPVVEKTTEIMDMAKDGTIFVRETTLTTENGKQISKKYHRWTFAPGQEISLPDKEKEKEVEKLSKKIWTNDFVKNYRKEKAEQARRKP